MSRVPGQTWKRTGGTLTGSARRDTFDRAMACYSAETAAVDIDNGSLKLALGPYAVGADPAGRRVKWPRTEATPPIQAA